MLSCLISSIELFYHVLFLTFSYCVLSMSPAQLLCLVITLLSSHCTLSYLSCTFIVSYLICQFHLSQPVSSLPVTPPCFVSHHFCTLYYLICSFIISCLTSSVQLFLPLLSIICINYILFSLLLSPFYILSHLLHYFLSFSVILSCLLPPIQL